MQPHLIKGVHAEYTPAQWSGTDTSGVRVVGKTVLVLMDECAKTTSGGIALTEDMIERMSMAAESGVLVACAAGAFLLNEDMTPWSGPKPKPGDRVYIEKYAGKQIRGRDGKTYRIMDYGSIGATYEAEPSQGEAWPIKEFPPRDAISGGTGDGSHDGVGTAVPIGEITHPFRLS